MPLINFSNTDINSPEKNIIQVIQNALQFIAAYDFSLRCLSNILLNVSGLNDNQKIALKLVAKSMLFDGGENSIGQALNFICYGSFEDVGADEASGSPLSLDQRSECLRQIYLTAQSIIASKIVELQNYASQNYVEPDWRI